MIQLVGILPIGSLNVGLGSASAGVSAEVAKLQADASNLDVALKGSIDVAAHFPPDPVSIAAVIGAGLSASELSAIMNPAGWVTIGAEANIDIALQLGFIEGQIGAVAQAKGAISAGLDAGGISGWSYFGRCSGLGAELAPQVRFGFGGLGPADEVTAIVIVTESFASWRELSKSMAAAPANTPATSAESRIVSHGPRSGADWNTGTAELGARIDAFSEELDGLKASLEEQAELSLGLNLPDVEPIVDAGIEIFGSIGADGIADNLVNVRTDVTGLIQGISADAGAIASVLADVDAQLSAGGFATWSYRGRADQLAKEVEQAMANGLPNGSGPSSPVYALVLAGSLPSMSLFAGIFQAG